MHLLAPPPNITTSRYYPGSRSVRLDVFCRVHRTRQNTKTSKNIQIKINQGKNEFSTIDSAAFNCPLTACWRSCDLCNIAVYLHFINPYLHSISRTSCNKYTCDWPPMAQWALTLTPSGEQNCFIQTVQPAHPTDVSVLPPPPPPPPPPSSSINPTERYSCRALRAAQSLNTRNTTPGTTHETRLK